MFQLETIWTPYMHLQNIQLSKVTENNVTITYISYLSVKREEKNIKLVTWAKLTIWIP